MKIKTDRLILRRFTPDDTETMIAINADPRVMECFPSTMSRDETRAHLKRIETHWAENNFGLFAIEALESGK
jgi:RimJ/RimL family protein N-acetyltransferase